jgi:hypothetical protein
MIVLISGGGRTGTQLATLLMMQNHDVRLIGHRPEILARTNLPGRSLKVMLPIPKCLSWLVSNRHMSSPPALQMMNKPGCLLPGAPCTSATCIIARINNPRNAWLFDRNFRRLALRLKYSPADQENVPGRYADFAQIAAW